MSLENTVAKYEVQISRTGDGAATAAADFQKLDAASKSLNVGLATTTDALLKAMAEVETAPAKLRAQEAATIAATAAAKAQAASLTALRYESMALQSSMRELSSLSMLAGGGRFAEMGYGLTAASAGLRALRSAAAVTGLELATLGPILGTVAAAVGAAIYIWHEHSQAMKDTQEQAKGMAKSLEALPALIEKINTLQRAGLVSGSQAESWLSTLGHPGPSTGPQFNLSNLSATNIPPSAFAQQYPRRPAFQTGPVQSGPIGMVTPDAMSSVQKQMQSAGLLDMNNVMNPEVQALVKLKELRDKLTESTLTGLDKERAEAKKTYDDEIAQINQLAATAGKKASPDLISGAKSAAQSGLDTRTGAIDMKQIAQQQQLASEQGQEANLFPPVQRHRR